MTHHHSNSRRFRCKCGELHAWSGHYRDLNDYQDKVWIPRNRIDCYCGEIHVRGKR